MADTFTICGDEIRFGPWTVGHLDPSIPATVRARVEDAIEERMEKDSQDAYRRGYDDGVKETDNSDEVSSLEREIECLEAALQDALAEKAE